jgi:alpha-1,6-mannosyltransferase
VLLVVLAVRAAVDRRSWRALSLVGVAIQTKLLPALLAPHLLRGAGRLGPLVLLLAIALPAVPYAGGPLLPPGLHAYAERWEWNASAYRVVEWSLVRADAAAGSERVVRAIGARLGIEDVGAIEPRALARGVVATLALGWLLWLARRRSPLDHVSVALWSFGGVLLLGPVLHPWYLLWVLPWAAARAHAGWLALCAAVPLAYTGSGDVSGIVRLVEYGIPGCIAAWAWCRARRSTGEPEAMWGAARAHGWRASEEAR